MTNPTAPVSALKASALAAARHVVRKNDADSVENLNHADALGIVFG